jgi:hypothetical protein
MRHLKTRFLLTGFALVFGHTAFASKIYTVDSVEDLPDDDIADFVCHTIANTCTLRAAVMQASYNSFAVTDAFFIEVPAGVYNLDSPTNGGELLLNTPPIGSPMIVIVGAGAGQTIISGFGHRVLHVADKRTAIFQSFTVRNGNADLGAGIGNEGTLNLNSVVVDHNLAQIDGGGIYNYGVLSIADSTISNNTAGAQGAGIYNDYKLGISISMTIERSAIVGNLSYSGAGIENVGEMTIINGTIAGNQARGDGGGIYNSSSQATNIYNTTIAYNGSDSDRDFVGSGGGIYSQSFTVSANLYNSILAGNTTSNTPIPDDCFGALKTHARNRFGTKDGCAITEISGSWELLSGGSLGGLQDNGGPSLTIALQAGSNAIDATDPNAGCRDQFSNPITLDQRGAKRVGLCDIGAYEYGSLASGDQIFANGFNLEP